MNRLLAILFAAPLYAGCDDPQPLERSLNAPPEVPFTIELRASDLQIDGPFVHSAALAVRGSRWLIVGGRVDGFHGRTNAQQAFPTTRANDSLWVIDVSTGQTWGAPVPAGYVSAFTATNAQFLQVDGLLYIVGGFAARSPGDTQFNTTLDTFTAIDVDAMIDAVVTGADPSSAVTYSLRDTLFLVTGGELVQLGGSFYLVMGQNYDTAYAPGINGRYTLQVRQFSTDGSAVTVQGIYEDEAFPADSVSRFRRRDLNVVPAVRGGMLGATVYGGAFTVPDDDGWTQPVYIDVDASGATHVRVDTTFEQTSNQYQTAQVLIYDAGADVMYTSLLGGIGAYRYDPQSGSLVEGDHGAKLPFVKLITTIATAGGVTTEFIQSPITNAPMMPDYLGANGYFIPDSSLAFAGHILEYDLLGDSTTYVGKFYGGIQATAPTSSAMNPTFVNRTMYDVYVRKR